MQTVTKPSHYTRPGEMEVIDQIRLRLTEEQFLGYCLGSAVKYLERTGHKYPPLPTWRTVRRDIAALVFPRGRLVWILERKAETGRQDLAKSRWYRRMSAGDDPRRDP